MGLCAMLNLCLAETAAGALAVPSGGTGAGYSWHVLTNACFAIGEAIQDASGVSERTHTHTCMSLQIQLLRRLLDVM